MFYTIGEYFLCYTYINFYVTTKENTKTGPVYLFVTRMTSSLWIPIDLVACKKKIINGSRCLRLTLYGQSVAQEAMAGQGRARERQDWRRGSKSGIRGSARSCVWCERRSLMIFPVSGWAASAAQSPAHRSPPCGRRHRWLSPACILSVLSCICVSSRSI